MDPAPTTTNTRSETEHKPEDAIWEVVEGKRAWRQRRQYACRVPTVPDEK